MKQVQVGNSVASSFPDPASAAHGSGAVNRRSKVRVDGGLERGGREIGGRRVAALLPIDRPRRYPLSRLYSMVSTSPLRTGRSARTPETSVSQADAPPSRANLRMSLAISRSARAKLRNLCLTWRSGLVEAKGYNLTLSTLQPLSTWTTKAFRKINRRQDAAQEGDVTLQELGRLIRVSREQLRRMRSPKRLPAVLEAQRITSHRARRRQTQFVGRLMRSVDPQPIHDALDALPAIRAEETARQHRSRAPARETHRG